MPAAAWSPWPAGRAAPPAAPGLQVGGCRGGGEVCQSGHVGLGTWDGLGTQDGASYCKTKQCNDAAPAGNLQASSEPYLRLASAMLTCQPLCRCNLGLLLPPPAAAACGIVYYSSPQARQPVCLRSNIAHHPGSAGGASDGATRQVSMPSATQQEQGRAPTHSTAHQTASSSYSTRKSARVRGCMRRCASF